jgi:F-type H+-transporting ATPase subunit c
MKKLALYSLVFVAVLAFAGPVFAAAEKDGATLDPAKPDPNGPAKADMGKYVAIAMGSGLGFAAAFGALGQAKAIGSAVEAIARQPEAAANIRGALIIGLALIETLVIYVLLICFFLNGKMPVFGG